MARRSAGHPVGYQRVSIRSVSELFLGAKRSSSPGWPGFPGHDSPLLNSSVYGRTPSGARRRPKRRPGARPSADDGRSAARRSADRAAPRRPWDRRPRTPAAPRAPGDRAGAHGAGLERDEERRPDQPLIAELGRARAHHQHFGMGGRIVPFQDAVAVRRQKRAIRRQAAPRPPALRPAAAASASASASAMASSSVILDPKSLAKTSTRNGRPRPAPKTSNGATRRRANASQK